MEEIPRRGVLLLRVGQGRETCSFGVDISLIYPVVAIVVSSSTSIREQSLQYILRSNSFFKTHFVKFSATANAKFRNSLDAFM